MGFRYGIGEWLALFGVLLLTGCGVFSGSTPIERGYIEVELREVVQRNDSSEGPLLRVRLLPHNIARGVRISAISLEGIVADNLRFRDEAGADLGLQEHMFGLGVDHVPFPEQMIPAWQPAELVLQAHWRRLQYIGGEKTGEEPPEGASLQYNLTTYVWGDHGEASTWSDFDRVLVRVHIRGCGWTTYRRSLE